MPLRRTCGWLRAGLFGATLALFGTVHAQNVEVSTGGPVTTYSTIGAAFTAINAGTHTGAILIELAGNTTEAGPCVLNSSGAGSASYTSVLLRPRVDGVTVSGATATGRGLIELNGADNVTIDGDNPNSAGINRDLTFTNTAANTITYTSVIRLATSTLVLNCNDVTIRNCNVNGSGTNLANDLTNGTSSTGPAATTYGIIAGGGASTVAVTTAPSALASTATTIGTGQTANNFLVQNCAVTACGRAISAQGGALGVFGGANSVRIVNNLIGNPTTGANNGVYGFGINVSGHTTGSQIRGNTVYVEGRIGTSTAAIAVGLIAANGNNMVIENNQVLRMYQRSTGWWGATGINLAGGTAPTGVVVRNNFITNVNNDLSGSSLSASFGTYGIRIAASTGWLVYNNSVNLYGPVLAGTGQGLSAALIMTATTQTGCDIRNNILNNTLSGGGASSAHASLALPASATATMNLTLNNNAYYCNTSANAGVLMVGTTFSAANLYTAANFNAAATTPSTNMRAYTNNLNGAGTNDNASLARTTPVPYVSNSDLHVQTVPAADALPLFQSGAAGTGVTQDIDGDARGTNPCMGADEFSLPLCTSASGASIGGTGSACNGFANVLTLVNPPQGIGVTFQWAYGPVGGPHSNLLGTNLTQNTNVIPVGTWEVVCEVTCSGCGPCSETTAPFALVVNPIPTVSAASNSPICAGQTLNLDATGTAGSTFAWTGPNSFNSTLEDPSIPSASMSANGTYSVIATLNGCPSTPATTTVVVNVAPVIQSLTATPNPVCVNSNSQLNVTATVDLPFVRMTEITFFRTGTGQTTPWPATIPTGPDDYVELNNTSGLPADISGWTYADYSSNSATPNHTLTFPAGTVIPPNGFIVIGLGTGTNDPGNYYYAATGTSNFYSSGGTACFILRNAASVIVDAVATNTAVFNAGLGVTPADWSGAGASAPSGNAGSVRTATLDSNTGADWQASSIVAQTIGTFNPGYTNTNQSAPSSYLWTPNTYLDFDNIANPLASVVSASETYTVTVGAANGCTTQGVLALNTTLQITGANITGNLSYCAGGSTTLTAVPNDGGPPFTYLWVPGGQTTASINVTSPGSYYCIVDDACGGSVQTATVNVVENPLPTVTVSPNTADYCIGNPAVQLLASGAVSYSWSPAAGLNTASGANVDASPGTSTVYTVTGTDANGCQDTDVASITVLGNAPTITSATANPNPVCPGSNSQLSASAQANAGIYAVSSIPYALVSGTPTTITNWANGGSNSADDGFSPAIPLPFPFLFNGAAVNQLWVGSNGYVTFNVPTAVTGLECRTSANMSTATNPNGVVALCFADLNVTGGAAIGTFVSGTPGSQVFVINFSALPFFSNTGSVNGQIHLYEGTNRIEVHVTNVDPGTSVSARALGIENQAGSDRVFAPGRASGTWTVSTPEAWRFEPPQANYSWSPVTFLNNPNIADPLAQNVTAATLYTLTVSNNAGCTATTTVNLAVETTDGDGDGIADCADSCPSVFGQNGDPCDDLDPTTGNDILVNCVCVGQLIDCLGVPGGSALPGSACNDGDPLTANDTWDANCNCAGIPVDCEGNPGGPALPGSPCDDGNPATGNDTWNANCQCVGLPLDCLGVPGGPAVPGSPCDDNDATTGNDTWNANCICVGLPLDCVGVPGGTTLPGSPCNDGNPNTINDVYDANCVCAGTPIGGCNDNQVFLTINTDGNGSQTSWQIVVTNTNTVVCSGSNLLSNATVIGDCCLPDGCYDLRVSDSFGDGIAAPGGYVLRNAANQRIIDNSNNGNTFTTLSESPLGFCVPIGNDQMAASTCDNLNLTPTSVVVAVVNPAVSAQYNVTNATSGYQFWITNPHGGYSRRVFQAHNVGAGPAGATRCASLALSSLTTLPAPQNTILNVRVRSRVAGVYAEFGPACQMRIFAPTCSTTKLVDDPLSAVFSCGVVKKFGPANQTISAFSVFGANRYQFRFERVGGGYARNVASNDQNLVLNWSTSPLVNGDTYNVTVRVSFDGGSTYCLFGPVCQVTINNSLPQAGGRDAVAAQQGNSDLLMFPNPNRDGLVNLRLTGVPAEVMHVQVDVMDLFGKRVFSTQLQADALVNATLNLGELASGVYLVNLTGGDYQWNQRLVIQR